MFWITLYIKWGYRFGKIWTAIPSTTPGSTEHNVEFCITLINYNYFFDIFGHINWTVNGVLIAGNFTGRAAH